MQNEMNHKENNAEGIWSSLEWLSIQFVRTESEWQKRYLEQAAVNSQLSQQISQLEAQLMNAREGTVFYTQLHIMRVFQFIWDLGLVNSQVDSCKFLEECFVLGTHPQPAYGHYAAKGCILNLMQISIFLTVYHSLKIFQTKPLGCSSFLFAKVQVTPTFEIRARKPMTYF